MAADHVIWSTADLRVLERIPVKQSEVVYAFLSLVGEPSALDEAVLDDEERTRSRRFVRTTDRRRFVLAHAAMRLLLARCLGLEASSVRYGPGINGKPRLMPDLALLEFNLSHSREVGLIAVARERSVGVDVEHVRDGLPALSIADSHFSIAERRELRSLLPSERQGAFFRCWTRKEALIKASGEGLGRSLDSFDVDLAPGSTSALKRYAGRSGEEVGWSIRDLPSPPGYAAAGALGAPASPLVPWRELSTEAPGSAQQ